MGIDGDAGDTGGNVGTESSTRMRSIDGETGLGRIYRGRMGHLNYRYPNSEVSLAQMCSSSYDLAMTSPERTPLEIGTTDLAIGEYSVGVAPARTCEQLISAYLELVSLVRRDHPEYFRDEDFESLARATTQEASFFRNRVVSRLQTARAAS